MTTIALFAVLSGGDSGGSGSPGGSGGETRPAATTPITTTPRTGSGSSRRTRRYTVKAGDTPSSIAEEAGIPLDRLLELNPDIDPQALTPGERLKLAP